MTSKYYYNIVQYSVEIRSRVSLEDYITELM